MAMKYKIIIPGKFPTMNEFIDANRTGRGRWNKGNCMKQRDQGTLIYLIRKQMKNTKPTTPVVIRYNFYEENRRRDKDNVESYFKKIFQDALVLAKVIPNDGWNEVKDSFSHFEVDNKDPRIEVEIIDGIRNI